MTTPADFGPTELIVRLHALADWIGYEIKLIENMDPDHPVGPDALATLKEVQKSLASNIARFEKNN